MSARAERLAAVLAGEIPDRVPLSFWRHYPQIDHDPELLADAIVADFRAYDLDFIKMMPSGMYAAEDWGCTVSDPSPDFGQKGRASGPIKSLDDWARLAPADPRGGARGRELVCLARVRARVGPDVPVLQTVYSPVSTAAKLAGRRRLLAHLREAPGRLEAGLAAILASERAYLEACLAAGASGFFYVTQFAGGGLLTAEDYTRWVTPWERPLAEDIAARTEFSVMHLHGPEVMFHLFTDIPLPCINLEDLSVPLPDRQAAFGGVIVGGLDQFTWLRRGDADEVRRQAARVLADMAGRPFILAPGCVLPLDIGPEKLRAVRQVVGPGAAA